MKGRLRPPLFWGTEGRILAGIALTLTVFARWAAGDGPDGETTVFDLSPFTVSTSLDDRYLSTNAVSGTSLNTLIRYLPMSIQVINDDFLEDFAASDLEEALVYAAGVFTDDNEADLESGTTRGIPGGLSGDRSVSSAGKGSLLGNRAYIRGLTVPYQSRMGFRYGGIVLTPSANITLGGLMDAVNMQRIEIVKGPNSILYGTGVLSGIVNVLPKRPSSESALEVGIRAGSHDFLRTQVDFSGPLRSDFLPGQLNYRLAGAYETRGHWTDFRSERTEYWTAQLEYAPTNWMKLFLEYQDGLKRINGIGPQWIYDSFGFDSEFRNEYDEAYNWARQKGTLQNLRVLDPSGFNPFAEKTTDSGDMERTIAFRQTGTAFIGGGLGNGYRISGPDTFTERKERNFIADLEVYPLEGLILNAGVFLAEQHTEGLTFRHQGGSIDQPRIFVELDIPSDAQLGKIWESGGVYGMAMQDAMRKHLNVSSWMDPEVNGGDYISRELKDDTKFIHYWWQTDYLASCSEQFRLRATYTFESPFVMGPAIHTFLAGYHFIEDDVDFPAGETGFDSAIAKPFKNSDDILVDYDKHSGREVYEPYNHDGLYYRSIANFAPVYLDGRNDHVAGHNTVRAGNAFLNQVIRNEGIYGIYQGSFLKDQLRLLAGVRQDRYNAEQFTFKRVDLSDEALIEMAETWIKDLVNREIVQTFRLQGNDLETGNVTPEILSYRDELLDLRTESGRYIATYYRDRVESGNEGYFGYANRDGSPNESHGIVPGSSFEVFEKDIKADSYSLGVSYDVTADLTVYGLVSKGISPNTALRDGAGDVIPAEETLSREVGLKFEILGGTISGNLAVFRTRRKNGIWSVRNAPAPSKWIDAQLSHKRANNWSIPTYDPEVPTIYSIDPKYLRDYLSMEFGIPQHNLNFVQSGDQLGQIVELDELDHLPEGLPRIIFREEIRRATGLPHEFATFWEVSLSSQRFGINPEGIDDFFDITLYDPDTDTFITRQISNLPVLYAAFMDRENELITYGSMNSESQPQENNNVDIRGSALVAFDEEINGFEAEVFYSPLPNLQFVVGYTHVEREAENSFKFVEWESIVGTEGTSIPPFSALHRSYGWESAGIGLSWVDYEAYINALDAAKGGVLSIGKIPESALEAIPGDQVDETIPLEEFVSRNASGQILLMVDRRGNVLNENNSARATDFSGIISGVSLNYNPEDEVSVFCKYTFPEGKLEDFGFTTGFKYIGPSDTWIQFREIGPMAGFGQTPRVAERIQVDLGAFYRWEWRHVRMRLSLNVYNVTNETYSVTTKTMDRPNPITGNPVTKRTEKFTPPTTFRIGLTLLF